jgi:hypothetical protein
MKTTKPDPLADVTGFCEAWAEQACNADVVSHCSAASANACVAKQQSFCETLVPASKYSEQGALDCLDAVGKAYEDTVLTADERDTVLHLAAPCDKVLSGPGNEGDTCTVESDCDTNTGLTCVKKSPTGKGSCYVRPGLSLFDGERRGPRLERRRQRQRHVPGAERARRSVQHRRRLRVQHLRRRQLDGKRRV